MPTSTRPLTIPCEFCALDIDVKAKGRIPSYHPHCKAVVDAKTRMAVVMDEWEATVLAAAAEKGESLPSDEERVAAATVKSELMSMSNRWNALKPSRIRTDRDRAMTWNGAEGRKAAARLSGKTAPITN